MRTLQEWVTPILVTVAIFLIGGVITTTNKIDEKLFKHLTNDEIHCPRGIMVTRAEFDLTAKLRDSQIQAIKEIVKDELTQLRVEMRNPQVYKR